MAELRIKITRQTARWLDNEVRTHYPYEAMGMLLGRNDTLSAALALRNFHAEPMHAFAAAPQDLRQAESLAGELGLRVCGFYHSHPHSPAVPSADDLRFLVPGMLCLIIPAAGLTAQSAVCRRERPDGDIRYGKAAVI